MQHCGSFFQFFLRAEKIAKKKARKNHKRSRRKKNLSAGGRTGRSGVKEEEENASLRAFHTSSLPSLLSPPAPDVRRRMIYSLWKMNNYSDISADSGISGICATDLADFCKIESILAFSE